MPQSGTHAGFFPRAHQLHDVGVTDDGQTASAEAPTSATKDLFGAEARESTNEALPRDLTDGSLAPAARRSDATVCNVDTFVSATAGF